MANKFLAALLVIAAFCIVSHPAIAECPELRSKTALFTGLKAVALQVNGGRGALEKSVECHGQEEICARKELGLTPKAAKPAKEHYGQDLFGLMGAPEDILDKEEAKKVAKKIEEYKALYKLYPSLIRTGTIVKLLSDRIRMGILPLVEADHECQIPDLEVYYGDNPDRIYLKDFMRKPDHLLISVQIAFVYPTSDDKQSDYLLCGVANCINAHGSPLAFLTLNIVRTDSLTPYDWNGIGRARQMVIPLDAPANKIEERILLFLDYIWPLMPLPRSSGESPNEIKKYEEEALKNKPPVALIKRPTHGWQKYQPK